MPSSLIQEFHDYLQKEDINMALLSTKLLKDYYSIIELAKYFDESTDINKRSFIATEIYTKKVCKLVYDCKIEKYGIPDDLLQ